MESSRERRARLGLHAAYLDAPLLYAGGSSVLADFMAATEVLTPRLLLDEASRTMMRDRMFAAAASHDATAALLGVASALGSTGLP